ncbi:hypothetical protein ACTV13_003653, partial [Cronobacter sakazakii]
PVVQNPFSTYAGTALRVQFSYAEKLPYILIGGKQILLTQFNSQLVAELKIYYLLIQFASQLIVRTHTIKIYGSFLEPPIK